MRIVSLSLCIAGLAAYWFGRGADDFQIGMTWKHRDAIILTFYMIGIVLMLASMVCALYV